jgi:glycosyltransferase involved in cell wall biosynthesis
MKILFLTLAKIETLNEQGIYTDLLRKFVAAEDQVYVINPLERRENKKTYLIKEKNVEILRVKTFNIQKVGLIEKGLATLTIEKFFLKAVKKYFSEVTFDLVLYSTPPITFSDVIQYIKKRDSAFSYLLLKDIFPQNAVDMKMIKQGGFIHNFFLKKEKRLYDLSDKIGCLSDANKKFLFRHNQSLQKEKVEINPNSIEYVEWIKDTEKVDAVKKKYHLPNDKKIFAYGGNLGKPQGLDFLLETITLNSNAFFLIVGSGTEFNRVSNWFKDNKPKNAILLSGLPKNDYDILLSACDVGLIFLHKDFTIPNFPSRLLSYLEYKMPVLAATDSNTDIGEIIMDSGCGFWVESGDTAGMKSAIEKILNLSELELEIMKKNAYKLLTEQFDVEKSYQLIAEKIKNV